jgi:hypothetical protein
LPKDGQSLLDLTKLPEGTDEQVLANVVVEGEPRVAVMPAAASRHALYGSCTKDVAAWAIARQCPQPVSPACGFSAPKRRITEHLPNDGQIGNYRFVRRISTDKRPCVHEWSSSWLVAQPEAIHLGVTSVNSLLSHAPPFSTVRTSQQESDDLTLVLQHLSPVLSGFRTQFVPRLCP